MISMRRAVACALLAALPGTCIAAPPHNAESAPPPRVAPTPVAVGVFRLDRAPQQGGIALGTVPAGTVRLAKDGAEVPFARDGRFVIAFGRDHAALSIVSASQADGTAVTERPVVAPRRWVIETLATVPHHAQPDAEYEARRPGELAQISAARRIASDSEGWRQPFIWPVRGRISGLFGSQRIYAGEPGAPHAGVDIAVGQGTPVAAPADGVVILAAAAPFTLEGNLLMIDHGMGLNSAFLHLSRIDVKPGDHVRQGQIIGLSGMTGRASGPHLHWGMKWQDERIDPATLTGPMALPR